MKPKVTAIITTHNRQELVSRAIESVLNQTYDNLDCIVVDDASDISAESVCKKYPVRYVYIPKEESTGGNHARNIGILASDAKYVAFLDDDDYWEVDKIEKQVSLIEEKKCELVYSGARPEIIKNGQVLTALYTPNYYNQGDMKRKILYGICCLNITILADRQALIDVGLFDENIRFWQEYELTIRMAQRKPFYFVPEPLAIYRVDINDKGRLTNNLDKWQASVDYIYEKHSKLFSNLNFIEKERVRLNYIGDAKNRAKNAHLYSKAKYYNFLLNTRYIPIRLLVKIQSLFSHEV